MFRQTCDGFESRGRSPMRCFQSNAIVSDWRRHSVKEGDSKASVLDRYWLKERKQHSTAVCKVVCGREREKGDSKAKR